MLSGPHDAQLRCKRSWLRCGLLALLPAVSLRVLCVLSRVCLGEEPALEEGEVGWGGSSSTPAPASTHFFPSKSKPWGSGLWFVPCNAAAAPRAPAGMNGYG